MLTETERDIILNPDTDYLWEVHGHSEFSSGVGRNDWVETTVFVKALTVNEAANKAVEMMGVNPKIEKVYQVGYNVLEEE